jgi:DHA1 family bicyclomycin/chloramphenicol resistance-like MFS transporter
MSTGRQLARFAVLGGLSSFGPLSLDLYLPALPRVARSLDATDGLTQLSISACLVGLAIGQLAFGPLGDRFGRRRPLLAGVAGWTVASLLCAAAPNAEVLIALRFVEGAGGAAGLVLARAVIRDLYDAAELARAFARVALLSNIAPVVAPIMGGLLLYVIPWRGLFVTLTVIGVVLLGGTAVALPESLPEERRRRGGIRSTVTAVRELSRDRLFLGSIAVFACSSAMLFTYISLSSFVLQQQFGFDASAFSAVFAANSVGIVIAGWVCVRLLRRRAPQFLLGLGLMLAMLGSVLLCAAVLGRWPVWSVLPPLLLAIGSIGLILPSATGLALLKHAGAAGAGSALLGGTQFLMGAVAGPIVSAAGASAAAMAIGMGVSAVGAVACYRIFGIGRTRWVGDEEPAS